MNKKNLFLITGILALVVFIGYLGEAGPHTMFGMSVNIWVIRLVWLLISVANFANYFKIKKAKKKSE